MRCNAEQTNTPCVYPAKGGCLLRTSNCTGKPCTEGIHRPIGCDDVVAALAKPARVCLELQALRDGETVQVTRDGQRHGATAAIGAASLRLCGQADRRWAIGVQRGSRTLEGALDWTAASCFTLDPTQPTIAKGCTEPFAGKTFENRL